MKQTAHFLAFITVAAGLFSACGSSGGSGSVAPAEADSVVAEVDSTALTESSDSVSTAADETFDDFFFNYAVNRRLQKKRTKFPLPELRGDKTTHIAEKAWQMDYFFMRQDYYTLLFDSEQEIEEVKNVDVNTAIVEKIYFNTQSVKQYWFRRENGLWMLYEIAYIPVAASHNSTFLQFYQRFATDTAFQTASLDETVKFVGPDPDDDFVQMEGLITPDTWPAFAPQLPQKMIYNIVYGQPRKERDTKVFVLRGIANGLEIELCFKRKAGKWRLTKMIT